MHIKNFLFKNTGTRQTVVKNTFWLTASEVGSRLLRALVLIYAARILGAGEYGVFSYVLGLAGFFTVFADIGVKQIMTREVSQKPEEATAYFITALWIKTGLLLITSLLIVFIAPRFSNIEAARSLIPLVALLTIFDNLREFAAGYFRGREKMQYEALLIFVTNIAIAVLGFLILRVAPTARALTITYVLAAGAGTILGIVLLRNQFSQLFSQFKKPLVKRILNSAWPIALIGLVGVFMLNVDVIMLGFYKNAEAIGFYSASQKIVQIIYTLPAIFAVSVFPALSRFVSSKETDKVRTLLEKAIRAVYLIALPVAIGGFLLAPNIIRFLYGDAYLPAVPVFRILTLTPLIVFPSPLLGNFVLAHDKQKRVAPFVALGSVANIVLNLVFIPLYGIVGAALATLGAQIIYQGGLWLFSKRIMKFTVLRNLKRAGVATLFMGMSTIVMQLIGVHLLINIFVSILIYLGVLYALEEDILMELKHTVRG